MLLQTIIISITSPDQHSERQGPGSILSNVAVSGTHTAIWENYNVILLRIIFTPTFILSNSTGGSPDKFKLAKSSYKYQVSSS